MSEPDSPIRLDIHCPANEGRLDIGVDCVVAVPAATLSLGGPLGSLAVASSSVLGLKAEFPGPLGEAEILAKSELGLKISFQGPLGSLTLLEHHTLGLKLLFQGPLGIPQVQARKTLGLKPTFRGPLEAVSITARHIIGPKLELIGPLGDPQALVKPTLGLKASFFGPLGTLGLSVQIPVRSDLTIPGPLGTLGLSAQIPVRPDLTIPGPLGALTIQQIPAAGAQGIVTLAGPLGKLATFANPKALREGIIALEGPLGKIVATINTFELRMAFLEVAGPLDRSKLKILAHVPRDGAAAIFKGPLDRSKLKIHADEKGPRLASLSLSSPLAKKLSIFANPLESRDAQIAIPSPLGTKLSAWIMNWSPIDVYVYRIPGPLGVPEAKVHASYAGKLSFDGPLGLLSISSGPACQVSLAVDGPLGSLQAKISLKTHTYLTLEGPLGSLSSGSGLTLRAERSSLLGPGGTILEPTEPGMFVIPPGVIEEADVIFSTFEEGELDTWSATKCYQVGDLVIYSGEPWRALHGLVNSTYRNCAPLLNINRRPGASNVPNNLCVYEGHGDPWWVLAQGAASNKMSMFSPYLEYQTIGQGPQEVWLKPTFKIDTVGIFAASVGTIRMTLENPDIPGAMLLDVTVDMAYSPQLYPSVMYKNSWVYLQVPHYDPDDYSGVEAPIKLYFTGVGANLVFPIDSVRIGYVGFGQQRALGADSYGTKVSIIDYSKKDRDVFGLVTLKVDLYSYKVEYTFEAPMTDLEMIDDQLSDIRADICMYVGCSWLPETHVLGWYEDYRIPLSNFTISESTLTVLGMPMLGDGIGEGPIDNPCPANLGKTIFVCEPDQWLSLCAEEEPLVSDNDVTGEIESYGPCQLLPAPSVCANAPAYITSVSSLNGLLIVGVNGRNILDGVITPYTPWLDWNFRAALRCPLGDFAAGDDGLIVTLEQEKWVVKEDPYSALDSSSDYISLVYVPTISYGYKVLVALTRCGKRAFSLDGQTWVSQEDLPDHLGNRFDAGNFDISGTPFSDVVHIDGVPTGMPVPQACCLAVCPRKVYFCQDDSSGWTDYTRALFDDAYFTDHPEATLVSGIIYSGDIYGVADGVVIVAGRNFVAYRSLTERTWVLLESPSESAIVSISNVSGIPYVSFEDGTSVSIVIDYGLSFYFDSSIVAPMLGTIAPQMLWDVVSDRSPPIEVPPAPTPPTPEPGCLWGHVRLMNLTNEANGLTLSPGPVSVKAGQSQQFAMILSDDAYNYTVTEEQYGGWMTNPPQELYDGYTLSGGSLVEVNTTTDPLAPLPMPARVFTLSVASDQTDEFTFTFYSQVFVDTGSDIRVCEAERDDTQLGGLWEGG